MRPPHPDHPDPPNHPDRPGPSGRSDEAVLADVAEILDAEEARATRVDPRLRRFRRSLVDLGLPVPADWARLDDEGRATFTALDARAFEQLLRLLEDIATARSGQVLGAGGRGPVLFDAGPPTGPVTRTNRSTVHMELPR